MHDHLLIDIGKSLVGAALLGVPAYLLRLPLILAYLGAGVLLGPHLGLGLIQSSESISTLSEIGLVLLMFILGLEIDLRKLLQAGKAVLINGVTQFVGCALLGIGFFYLLGFEELTGNYGLIYLAIACALSSTLIVVKILSERMELDTLTSRITLGVLVIQDIWAIGFLAVQPNLANLSLGAVGISAGKAMILVFVSAAVARFILPRLFVRVGKQPELMLILALGWCFAVCGMADALKLSLEMGALVAGICIASFPYRVDVAAKVASLRDFFITLFFVGLGLQIPFPTADVLVLTSGIVAFVLLSRILTIFPVLHFLKYGNRSSLLPALNLSQVSEFSLVLASLGISYGHIKPDLLSAFILAMVITALLSSVLIPSGHSIYRALNSTLEKIGFKDHVEISDAAADIDHAHPQVVILGFYREASSLLQEMLSRHSVSAMAEVLVVDFNPEAHQKLVEMGINCQYGDIGHLDTLRHLELAKSQILVCTIPDQGLKGTTNLKLLRNLKELAPNAKVVVTAETIQSAIEMYKEGADYVFIPRLISAHYLADVLERVRATAGTGLKENALAYLQKWNEVLP